MQLESLLYIWYQPCGYKAMYDFIMHFCFFLSIFRCIQIAMYFGYDIYVYTVLVPLLGLLLHRGFVVFHDCCHESYFPSITYAEKKRKNPMNVIIATLWGIFTMTSPNWMLDHGIHHQTNGRLHNKYGFKFNELLYYNTEQYRRFTKMQKWIFSFFHTPLVFFIVFPLLYFGVIQRGIYLVKKWKYGDKIHSSWSTIWTHHIINNVGVYMLIRFAMRYNMVVPYLLATYIGWLINFIFFFNQHTYNPCYVVKDEEWSQKESGILGSSFIQIPMVFKYFTMGIEYHHVHHMNTKIPGYHTQEYHESVYEVGNGKLFENVVHISLSQCMSNLWLVLYDETKQKYITRQEADAEINNKKQE